LLLLLNQSYNSSGTCDSEDESDAVVLKFRVKIGTPYKMTSEPSDSSKKQMTFSYWAEQGYDSVKVNFLPTAEWCVYNCDQVTEIWDRSKGKWEDFGNASKKQNSLCHVQ